MGLLNFHDSAEVEGVGFETGYSEPKGGTFSGIKDPHFRLVATFRLRNGFESGPRWWQLKGVFPGLLVDVWSHKSEFLEGES